MARMGTNAGSAVEIWNPRTKAWCLEDVDHSMNLKGQPELLIRFIGVKFCPGFERLIGEPFDEFSTPATSKGKRSLHIDDEDVSLIVDARRAVASTWQPLTWSGFSSVPPPPSSSHSGSSTSFPSPFASSPVSSFPPSPTFSSLDLPRAAGIDDFAGITSSLGSHSELSLSSPSASQYDFNYDLLWREGYVHVPNTDQWPVGMYARDMAWGLTKMKEFRKDPAGRFGQVFPGVSFKKATFYRQMDAFFGSTVKEMERCRNLARSAGGLWIDWRAESSGWEKVARDRKK